MGTYVKGNLVHFFCFFEEEGERITPDLVRFKIKDPNGTITSYEYGVDEELLKDADDLYTIDILVNIPGQWFYRFESEDEESAFESEILVRKGQF